jgi:probable dihydroxyacetone kinase regulator
MTDLTKRALADSLIRLAQEKPFSKITVTDIVKGCGVNRMTFYYHFKDIYDLVDWILLEDAKKVIKGNKTYLTWQDGYLDVLKEMISHKEIMINAYSSLSRENLDKYVHSVAFKFLYPVVEEESKGLEVQPEDKKFIASFYSYAFVGLTLEWVGTGMKEDPEELVKRLALTIKGNIPEALKKYSRKS